jgi:meiosis-specific protein HOP1
VKGKGKAKAKQGNRKNLQKTKYVFNKSSKRTPVYHDYFNPDQVVENRMLGLSDLVCALNFFPFSGFPLFRG